MNFWKKKAVVEEVMAAPTPVEQPVMEPISAQIDPIPVKKPYNVKRGIVCIDLKDGTMREFELQGIILNDGNVRAVEVHFAQWMAHWGSKGVVGLVKNDTRFLNLDLVKQIELTKVEDFTIEQ